MNGIFHILLGFFLILLQTVFCFQFHFIQFPYNLVLSFIVFISLFRPVKEGLAPTVIIGLLLDGMSGVPFGAYVVAFLWIFVFLKWLTTFFHARSLLVLILSSLIAVIIENIISLYTFTLLDFQNVVTTIRIHSVIKQMLWAGLMGPLMIVMIDYFFYRWTLLGK